MLRSSGVFNFEGVSTKVNSKSHNAEPNAWQVLSMSTHVREESEVKRVEEQHSTRDIKEH